MIRIDAFAKVNLYLHVCGKREDGYHELDSLVVFAQTGDVLELRLSEKLTLRTSGPQADLLPKDNSDNLVLKAAQLLRSHFGVKAGAEIHLIKNLPVAAGIGGGSVDAAACLCGLCDLWYLQPSFEELAELGLQLGADVPVCLASRAAHFGGVGEKVTPYTGLPEMWMVLVNPLVEVSTPAVFKKRHGDFRAYDPLMTAPENRAAFYKELKARHNDLMEPAQMLAPVISDVLGALNKQDACELARMSGSGATCFGLFDTETAAQNAAQKLLDEQGDWWVSPPARVS